MIEANIEKHHKLKYYSQQVINVQKPMEKKLC